MTRIATEKEETLRLMTDPEVYKQEIIDKMFEVSDEELTEYQKKVSFARLMEVADELGVNVR